MQVESLKNVAIFQQFHVLYRRWISRCHTAHSGIKAIIVEHLWRLLQISIVFGVANEYTVQGPCNKVYFQ